MSEESMIELAQAALEHHGIDDKVVAVGQFAPRGQSGAMMAGGLLGDDVAGGIGLGAGVIAGRRASAAASGLPTTVMVALTDAMVYGMHSRSRRSEPDTILFSVPRAGLAATVHQRVNVRVLELDNAETGQRIQLEGSRVPVTHSKDVISVLTA
jgi:hypothetical protein